jgi:hypothetical protein
MKIVHAALARHLAGQVTTLATCWQITRSVQARRRWLRYQHYT